MRIINIIKTEKFTKKIIRSDDNLTKRAKNNNTLVQTILDNVKKDGDAALRNYEKKFSQADISTFRLSKKEIKDAYSHVTKPQLAALKLAKGRLYKTELAVKSLLKNTTINHDGIEISKKFVPINSVGCYIPGGLAKYPSTAVMSIVPAKIAGVPRVVAVSPPNPDGGIDPLTVVAADVCGADEIYKTGGAQAIAALSYGTESIPHVDKIVGPGGAFVTTAKSLVSTQTGIDMLAGPTELGIVADDSANPKFIALDLISQAEHSRDTFCYLLTTSKRLAGKVNKILSEIVDTIQRDEIVKYSLGNNGFIGICNSVPEMIRIANILAPEHLEIMTRNPQDISSKILSAGLVLIGENTPSSASDYLFGSNHTLPTNGFGKIRGSLSVLDFLKINTKITSSKESLSDISEHLKVLTTSEGLANHFEAVRGRLD